jgi:hypothetical protein
MAQVFSRLLAAYNPGSPATGVFPVDAGYVWVVRDIDCWCDDPTPPHAADGFRLSTSGGTVIWELGATQATTRRPYHWEGRQVMEDPDDLFITTSDSFWSVRVSGFKLILP